MRFIPLTQIQQACRLQLLMDLSFEFIVPNMLKLRTQLK